MSWKSFKDLVVWQKSIELTKEIYNLVSLLPNNEKYVISDQMRRAAVSIPSNIAEGQSRQSKREFVRFIHIATGSVSELETQLIICEELNLLTDEQIQHAVDLCYEIRKMLTALVNRLRDDY